MNKKGFTLIELLGTISIISLISILVVRRIIDWYSNSVNNYEELNEELIIEGARIYIEENPHIKKQIQDSGNPRFISMNELINYGSLDENNVKKISKENLENAKVRVTYNGSYFEYYLEK